MANLFLFILSQVFPQSPCCFLNRGKSPQKVEFDWSQHVIKDNIFDKEFDFSKMTYNIRDLWAKKNIGTTKKKLDVIVPGHDVYMIRLSELKN